MDYALQSGAKAILELEKQREDELKELYLICETLMKEKLEKTKQAEELQLANATRRINLKLNHSSAVEFLSINNHFNEECQNIGSGLQLQNENLKSIVGTSQTIEEKLQCHKQIQDLQSMLSKKLDNLTENIKRIKNEIEKNHESFNEFTIASNNTLQINEETIRKHNVNINEIDEDITQAVNKNLTIISKCEELKETVDILQNEMLTNQKLIGATNNDLLNLKREFEIMQTKLLQDFTETENGISEKESIMRDLESKRKNLMEQITFITENNKKDAAEILKFTEVIKEKENLILALKIEIENKNAKHTLELAEENLKLDVEIKKSEVVEAETTKINDVLNKRKEFLERRNVEQLELETDCQNKEDRNASISLEITKALNIISNLDEEIANLTLNLKEINQDRTNIEMKDNLSEQEYIKQHDTVDKLIEETKEQNKYNIEKLRKDKEDLITRYNLLQENQFEKLELLENENDKSAKELLTIEDDVTKTSSNVDNVQLEILILRGKYNILSKSNEAVKKRIVKEQEKAKVNTKVITPVNTKVITPVKKKRSFDEASNSSIEAISFQELRKKKLMVNGFLLVIQEDEPVSRQAHQVIEPIKPVNRHIM